MSAQKKIAIQEQVNKPLSMLSFRRAEGAHGAAPLGGLLFKLVRWLRARFSAATSPRRLQVTATVPLGEKRFVALVKVDGREFLVGGGAANVALLAPLDEQGKSFHEVLDRSAAQTVYELSASTQKRAVRTEARATKPRPIPKSEKQTAGKSDPVKTAANTGGRVRLSAQMKIAPALGHFNKPALHTDNRNPEKTTARAGRRTARKPGKKA
jgi:flagellar biogenesis protein FliO